MPLFEIKINKALKVNQKDFKDELELHKLIDQNLQEIFNIRYIRDEYITDKHGRIETLGIDESNRPVVIEYKRTMEKGQLVQANRYIIWVKQNPDSFELLVRKNISNILGVIDFVNPRIICFAQEFSIDDKCLALSLDAELWKYRYYENDMLLITREEEPEQLVKSKGSKTYTIQKINKEPKPHKTIDELLAGASPEINSTFEMIDNKIMGISSEIERYTTTIEVLYKTSFNFVCLAPQKKNNRLRIYLRTIQDKINDPKSLTEKVPKQFGYGNITRLLFIYPNEIGKKYSWDDLMDLVMQSYNTTQ
jgi:predicted transport protein